MTSETTPPHYHSADGYLQLMAWYEKALCDVTVPHDRHTVMTRFGPTHLIKAGDPTDRLPIVLLHGININASVWIPQINGLASRRRLIVPDVPGFVGLGSDIRIAYDGPALAHWLADVLDRCNVERALVVGGSAGGYFAMKAAAHIPGRVAGVILMNPCGLAPYRHLYKLTRFPPTVRFLHWMSAPVLAHRWIARAMVEQGMARDNRPTDANVELAYLILKHYRRRPPPPLLTDNEWERIACPLLLMSSEHELYTNPYQVMATVSRRLRSLATIDYVERVGHDINKEVPDYVNAMVLAFHRRLDAAERPILTWN
jgi:pimeloyl-ACP methyl ester carboxylesterase